MERQSHREVHVHAIQHYPLIIFFRPQPDGAAIVPGTALDIKPADPSAAHEQVVTPWDVQGSVSADGKQLAIDYDKLIDQFGTRRVDAALLERFEKLTGHKPHPLLRRGMFFSHRSVSVSVFFWGVLEDAMLMLFSFPFTFE